MGDVSLESPDVNNPNFSQINDSNYFLEPLINDCLNGWVKFIFVDKDPTLV